MVSIPTPGKREAFIFSPHGVDVSFKNAFFTGETVAFFDETCLFESKVFDENYEI